MLYRRCTKCRLTMSITEFTSGPVAGYHTQCRACYMERKRDYKRLDLHTKCLAHIVNTPGRAVEIAYGKLLYGPDREKIKAKRRRLYAKHGEAIKARVAAYQAANRGKVRLAVKAWKLANPLAVNQYHGRRAERMRATADGSVTTDRMRALFAAAKKCPYCGKRLHDADKSPDHIIPLARGGAHSISNLTVCCLPCNIKKRDALPSVLL